TAIQAAPQDCRDNREDRENVPGQVVSENRKIPLCERKDVDDSNELALRKSEVDHGDYHRDPLQTLALSEEADQRQSGKAPEHCEAERLVFEIIGPAWDDRILVSKLPLILRPLRILLLRCLSANTRMNCQRKRKRQQKSSSQPDCLTSRHLAAPGGVSRA